MSAPSKTLLGDLLAESLRWCRSSAARFRQQRHFAATSHLEVAGDIAADCVKASNTIATAAHHAETHDREALRILDGVLADGRVEPAEVPELRRARSLAARSAETDHDIAEHAHVPA